MREISRREISNSSNKFRKQTYAIEQVNANVRTLPESNDWETHVFCTSLTERFISKFSAFVGILWRAQSVQDYQSRGSHQLAQSVTEKAWVTRGP